jgi:ribulose kinase
MESAMSSKFVLILGAMLIAAVAAPIHADAKAAKPKLAPAAVQVQKPASESPASTQALRDAARYQNGAAAAPAGR